ncbi:MAG: CDP-glycerol glycerophosphotransferase family protein [Eubacterium sp.]|nr:CDP-glycerol glycerophosphotransferase family protein [Eubacterium sp.]
MDLKAAYKKPEESFQINRQARNKLSGKYRWILRLHLRKPGKKTVNDYFYDLPLDEKSVILSGLGREAKGNLQYLLDVLNQSEDFDGWKVYIRTTGETDGSVNAMIRDKGWSRTETVPKGFDIKLETCKYLITESYFPYQFTKRYGQVVINTWHGTPLKKIGLLKEGNRCHKSGLQQKNFLCSDYLLYPNTFTRDVMWRSYKITHLLTGKALMMGYPRTAGMLKVTDEEKAALKSMLAPAGEKIYAYMPTFRGHWGKKKSVKRDREFLDYMDSALGNDEILYVHLHHHYHESDMLDFSRYSHIRNFPEDVDSYSLMTVTDALISDYSSVFVDYLILNKHVVLYIDDYDEYNRRQGLNIDIRELSLDMAFSREDVIRLLRKESAAEGASSGGLSHDSSEEGTAGSSSDKTDISEWYRYDAADNPEKLCGILLGRTDGLELQDIPRTDAKKVLIYTDGFYPGHETDMLKELTAVDSGWNDNTEVYVGCDDAKTTENVGTAYPELYNMDLIASDDTQPLSSIGSAVLDLYKSGKIRFKTAMEYLIHEYGLAPLRMYGGTRFDMVCIFDTDDPETVISLALSPAKQKALFFSDRMADKLLGGDRFLKDAVGFACRYCGLLVYTGSGSIPEAVLDAVPESMRNSIVRSDSADNLKKIIHI